MKIPGVFFVIVLIMSPASTAITDLGIPQNLQDCFLRMSRSSDSFIFSQTSRQNYCLKQYLNRRRRQEWLLESSLIPDTGEFKTPGLTPLDPEYNREGTYWSPPIRQWQYPTVNNFWPRNTRFWPSSQSSFHKVWKPTTKAPRLDKTWEKHFFIHTTKRPKPTTTAPTPTPTPKPKVFRTTTSAPPLPPLDWRTKPFNKIPSNNRQRTRFWRAPIWSVVPNVVRIPGIRFNNQWRYPNLAIDYPWNEYRNIYDIPEYPLVAVETIPEWRNDIFLSELFPFLS